MTDIIFWVNAACGLVLYTLIIHFIGWRKGMKTCLKEETDKQMKEISEKLYERKLP